MKTLPTIKDISQSFKKLNRQKTFRLSAALILLVGAFAQFLLPHQAQATSASAYIRLDRLAINATGGALVCFTPQTTATEGKFVLTFPGNGTAGAASFGVDQTASDWTVGNANLPAGSTDWTAHGMGTATTASGAVVTFPSGDLTVGTTYCFNILATNSPITNPSSIGSGNTLTGTMQTQTAGSSAIDTVTYAVAIVTTNADQIAVTASVPQSFSFALSANSIAFGTLTLGSVITGGTTPTVTITTNAQNGYQSWVKSANAALNSAATGGTIPSATADLASAKGYGLQVGSATGNASVVSPYTASGTNVGALATTYSPFVSFTGPSVAAGDTVTLTLKAKADATIKAGSDYADTLTVTAAGQF